MKNLDYDLNLPVHLARRDIFFTAAGSTLSEKTSGIRAEKHAAIVAKTLYLLKSAGEHAFLITKMDAPGDAETACVALLNMMHNQLLAAHFILDTILLLEKQHNRILPFTNASPATIEKTSEQLTESVRSLWTELRNTARITERTLLASRKENIKLMSKEDKHRYIKAGKELKKHLKEKLKHPDTIPSQIFYSIPGMKYE